MALIIDLPLPKNCMECRDNRISIPGCPLHRHTQGNWYRLGFRHPDCPILGEVDPDSFTRVIVTSGDGTVLGYKDITAREVLRLKDKPKEEQDA